MEIENEAGSFDDGSVSRVHQGHRHCSLVVLLLCTRDAMQVSRGLAGGGAAAGIQEARDGGCSPLRRSERRRPELFPAVCRERPAARGRCCCRGGTREGGGRQAGGDESRESDGLGPAALASREPEGRRGSRREKGGLGPAALQMHGARKNKQGIRRGRGGAYIEVVESSCLARQRKKRAGLLVWAEKVFPIFFLQKDSTNSI